MASQNIGSTTVAQIAIVVKDIEKAAKKYAAVFGLPVPDVIITEPGLKANMTFEGQPSDAQAKLAFFQLGQVQLELIEPMGGKSTWQDALDRKGEGFHHIGFWVKGMQESVEFLKSNDIPMIHRGDMGEGQYAYFDAEKEIGIILELLEEKREARAKP